MRYLSSASLAQVHRTLSGADTADAQVLERVVDEAHRAGLHAVAAALLVGIVREQPFCGGNREAALVAIDVLYAQNGWTLDASDGARIREIVDAAADGSISRDQVAARLAVLVRVHTPPALPKG